MARKRSKVLSTIRALGDKPEPPLTQHKQEDKGVVQPPLQTPLIPIVEESKLGLQEPESTLESSSSELVASLLLTSVLEEQLSESSTETAEAVHISQVSTSEATFEVNTSETTTPKVTESEPREPELKESAIAEPALETVLEATEPKAPIPQPEAEFPQPQPSQSEPKLTAAAPPTNDTRQAIAPRSDIEELLRRPEALVLIVVTFLWSIWQTYTNLWQRTPKNKN